MTNLHKPIYHFMPPLHWMNDPNGPIYHNEKYHMFYQYNPYKDKWANMHWGHAQSSDLVNWEHLPIALTPSPETGEVHCFSGCVVSDGDVPTLFYTSVGMENRNARLGAAQCMATSRDGMRSWKKGTSPIITNDIHGEYIMEWRDPFVWRENDQWNMLLGGSRNGYGCILLYRSQNLTDWEYVGIMLESKDASFLECPNLLRFGKKSVLIFSPNDKVIYHVGEVTPEGRFVTESIGVLDQSGRMGFYAPNTLLNDPLGRFLTWGWSPEEARGKFKIDGYNGALSLARELQLDLSGRLLQQPAVEYEQLRGEKKEICTSLNSETKPLESHGRALEIQLHTEIRDGDDFTLFLLETPDKLERTAVHFNAAAMTVTLEKGQTSLDNEPAKNFQRAVVPHDETSLDLRIFLDHSMIEIFINKCEVITGRLYPTRKDAEGVSLSGNAKNVTLTIWKMKPARFISEMILHNNLEEEVI